MRPGELDRRAKLHFARQAVIAQLTGLPSLLRAGVQQVRLGSCFAHLMRREATERPNSRAALLWHLGMRLPLHHNPLDSV